MPLTYSERVRALVIPGALLLPLLLGLLTRPHLLLHKKGQTSRLLPRRVFKHLHKFRLANKLFKDVKFRTERFYFKATARTCCCLDNKHKNRFFFLPRKLTKLCKIFKNTFSCLCFAPAHYILPQLAEQFSEPVAPLGRSLAEQADGLTQLAQHCFHLKQTVRNN